MQSRPHSTTRSSPVRTRARSAAMPTAMTGFDLSGTPLLAGGEPLGPARVPDLDSEKQHRAAFLWFHLAGFLAHATGVALALAEADLGASLPLWRIVPRYACPTGFSNHGCSVQLKVAQDVSLAPAWIVVAWFGCSALFHLVTFVCILVARCAPATRAARWYFGGMDRGLGWWRWLEYSASASIMLLGATALIGTRETRVVIASTVSIGVTMFFGWLAELNAAKDVVPAEEPYELCGYKLYWAWRASPSAWVRTLDRLHVHLLGYVPFALAWWLALDSFYTAEEAWTQSGAIDPAAGEALTAGFALFALFGVVQLVLLLLPFGPSVYWLGEVAYCVLSVAAKWTMALLLLYRGLTEERFAQAAGVPVRPA